MGVKSYWQMLGWAACVAFFLQPVDVYPQETQENVNAIIPPEVSLEETADAAAAEPAPEAAEQNASSQELVRKAWAASSQNDLAKLNAIVEEALRRFGEQALEEQASLQGFPARGKESEYQALNDVATVLFVQAEAVMNQGKKEEAIALFQEIIDEYSWAQAWDPRGWFWSVKEKSQASIDIMRGKVKEEPETVEQGIETLPHIHSPGKDKILDYTKYGKFIDVGTKDYHYQLDDPKGLADAAGEGIYPQLRIVLKNPGYKKAKDEGRLNAGHWDVVHSQDLEAALYIWALAPEPIGIKLFYIGMIFEKAKMYYEAIKAYHAIVVNFPQTVGWTYWQTPWYPAQAAIAKIKHIIRIHPELHLKAKWMKIEVKNGFDNDISNDTVITYPGIIEKKNWFDDIKERFGWDKRTVPLGKIKKMVGTGKVRLIQYENGHWQMQVNGKPFVLKGITYHPTKVGQSPDKGTLVTWTKEDSNNNGLPDGPYDSWVDANGNNRQDPNEPTVGDFRLMKEMGVNAIREYHHPLAPDKEVFRKMYNEYGIYLVMGDFLGKYTLGSGATWFEGTDYEHPEHQRNMMESVKKMVMEYKDEPFLLLWVLGNENNYGVASNADKKPAAYFTFVNEVAKMIKSLDPDHPVAVCNGDTLYLDLFAQHAPNVDIFAGNVYRGDYGFGSFWEQVYDASGRPAFITEYGSPAYAKHLTLAEGEEAQANYHRGNWLDIEANLAGRADGVGNALGGIAFEWTDEWWKNYEPFYHDRKSDAIGPFPGGYYYEEWFGITGQGDGQSSPFLRQLRKSYYAYKEMWN